MGFSIGEVESITGIKSHVLRYWEEVIPSLSPKKDMGGRRSYSSRDIQTILRLKYLIQEKKFTIEGARNQILEEESRLGNNSESSDFVFQIRQTRDELLEAFQLIKKYSKNNKD